MANVTDLLSLEISLRVAELPQERAELPQWWGRAAHQLLLDLVRGDDAGLAEQLHAGEQTQRPFTVSSLVGWQPRRGLQPGDTYRLKFTALSAPLAALLQRLTAPGGRLAQGAAVELDHVPFTVAAAPVVAEASYRDWIERYLLPGRYVAPVARLQLLSPTGFKKDGVMQQLFPEAALVFGSLLRRWNEFAPLALPEELQRYARECLVVQAFSLSTRQVQLTPQMRVTGAAGWVTYRAAHFDRYWMSLVETMTAFSAFSGIGAKVTMGLGQACVVAGPGGAQTD
ncbi:MAG: CRISPR system precrRNA processing endoribonuclease RAMP protein Cas6 [Anaerolineae bacterium]|nr:CRISPR system precrRNA processing endoribonuclease RAMP protein Cas6 [Anaerolineae bacterium]